MVDKVILSITLNGDHLLPLLARDLGRLGSQPPRLHRRVGQVVEAKTAKESDGVQAAQAYLIIRGRQEPSE